MTNTFKNGSGDFMAEYAINLLGNCCETLIILFFLKDNYRPRFQKIIFTFLCIAFTFFQFVNTSLFLSESPLVILGSLIFIFCVTMLYRIKCHYRVLFVFFIYLINAISETIVGMILAMIFHIDISYMQETVLLFAVCTITSKFLTYTIVLATKRKRFKTDTQLLRQNIIFVFLLPIASFLIMILILHCCYQINDTVFHSLTLIASIVLAIANIAVFFIIDKQNELIETKEKLLFAEKHINNQLVHYQELNKHQNELKIFRHDIKNRLVSLMALIKEGNSNKALQIMEKNLNWLDEVNNNIVNSGNPVIDAIIQAKLHTAKDKNISLQTSTKLAEEIAIDELELGIVLGNALDNAIEAVEKITNKESRYINLNLISTDDRISISILNPVEEDVDTEKLTTSKSDKEKHGYGIKSIKTIVQKHEGMVLFSCENKIFNISINMANK